MKLIRYEEKKSLNAIENIQAWLFRTTRNLCYDSFRSAKNRLEINIETEDIAGIADKTETPDTHLAKKDDMRIIKEQINALAPRAREIVVLKLEHDRSYKEIAEIMGISVSNVGFILHNAIRKIADGIRT